MAQCDRVLLLEGARHHLGLQSHAADRAASRPDLADLRMHRTGIDRAFGLGRLGLGLLPVEIFCGICGEFGPATGRAKMKGFALVIEAMFWRRGVDTHAANWIERRLLVAVTGIIGAAGLHFAGSRVFGCAHRSLHRDLKPVPCRGI